MRYWEFLLVRPSGYPGTALTTDFRIAISYFVKKSIPYIGMYMSCVSDYCSRDVLLILDYTLYVVDRANCVKGGDV